MDFNCAPCGTVTFYKVLANRRLGVGGLNGTLLPGVSRAEVIITSHYLDRCDQKRPFLIVTCHFWGRFDHRRDAQNRAEMPVCRTQPSAICSQTVIFGLFCRLNCRCLQPGRHFRALLMAEGAGRCSSAQTAETGSARSLDVSTPPHTAPAFGQARNVVEQVPSCRLRRHRSILRPPRIPVSAHSLRNQRPAPFSATSYVAGPANMG